MKLILGLILLIFCISNCQFQKSKEIKQNEYDNFPVLIDTNDNLRVFYFHEENNLTWLSTSNYEIFYIGKYSDTIYVDPFLNFSGFPKSPDSARFEKNEIYKRKYSVYEKFHIEWPLPSNHKSWSESKFNISVKATEEKDTLIPVLIKNSENDTTEIGYGNYLPMIMEALDSLGNWRPIQERFVYMCGNGVGTIILPPNYCVLTFAPKFKGEYKTKLRFKLGENHSEPFNGSIHYRQFKSKFGENGDYCDEYKNENKK